MSTSIHLINWHPGIKKIQTTQLLRLVAPLSLSEAKRITDNLLDFHPTTLFFDTSEQARSAAHQFQLLGAIVHAPDLVPPLLDDHFILWMAEQVVSVARSSLSEQAQSVHVFIDALERKLTGIAPTEHQHIASFLNLWMEELCVFNQPLPAVDQTNQIVKRLMKIINQHSEMPD